MNCFISRVYMLTVNSIWQISRKIRFILRTLQMEDEQTTQTHPNSLSKNADEKKIGKGEASGYKGSKVEGETQDSASGSKVADGKSASVASNALKSKFGVDKVTKSAMAQRPSPLLAAARIR